jgi:hypothetical protein
LFISDLITENYLPLYTYRLLLAVGKKIEKSNKCNWESNPCQPSKVLANQIAELNCPSGKHHRFFLYCTLGGGFKTKQKKGANGGIEPTTKSKKGTGTTTRLL